MSALSSTNDRQVGNGLVPTRPRLTLHEGVQDAEVIQPRAAGSLDGHTDTTRPLLEGANRIDAVAVEIAAVLRSLPLSEDLRLALRTALKLVLWAARAEARHATSCEAGEDGKIAEDSTLKMRANTPRSSSVGSR